MALALQPAILLAWYNGDPYCLNLAVDWTRAMMEHITAQAAETRFNPEVTIETATGRVIAPAAGKGSFSFGFADMPWAAYDLTGDKAFLDYARDLINYELRRPRYRFYRTTSIIGAYLNETGDPQWNDIFVKQASVPELWTQSLHNDYYRSLDYFYAAWKQTGEERWLDEGSRLALYHLTWQMPMLTIAEQSTDRVWLPQRLANRMTLGDLAILRNEIYPKQAVSWENATGKFAPLVRKHSRSELTVEIHNLENREVGVTARIWNLDHGEYMVHAASKSRDGSTPSAETSETREITRYSPLPLTLPAASVTTVSLRQKRKLGNVRTYADLAISPLDAKFDPKTNTLSCTVHNIGARTSGSFRVRFLQQGKEIAAHSCKALGPPENFHTQKIQLSAKLPYPGERVEIRIDPAPDEKEITLINNVIFLNPAGRTPSQSPE